jgi:hypothetical protein
MTMSDTVDGPAATAFNDPNALEIARLQIRIGQLAEAKAKADGSHKKTLIEGQIFQLAAQQAILSRQMVGDFAKHEPFDKGAIEANLVAQKSQLEALPSLTGSPPATPTEVRIKELDRLIAAVKGPEPATKNDPGTTRTSE